MYSKAKDLQSGIFVSPFFVAWKNKNIRNVKFNNMKIKAIILITVVLSTSCYASNSNNNITSYKMNDTIQKDTTKSIYWIHSSSRECQYEILINDISAFRSIADYEEKAFDCSMQINSFLKNGIN